MTRAYSISARKSTMLRLTQAGFSIAELMVGVALSLLVILALSVLFMNVNRTNTELAKTSSQIENGRFALQILQEDIAHGGFWGEYAPEFDNLTSKAAPEGDPLLMPTTPRAVPNPCAAFATWTEQDIHNLIGIPVQVYRETVPAGAACETDFSANRKAGTDLLVVRHAETCIAGSGGNCEDAAGGLYFQASRTYNNYCPAPLVSEIKPFVLSNVAADFNDMKDKDCATNIVRKRKYISNIYYVRDYARTEGDGIPTLMLSAQEGSLSHAEAMPLVEGIEAFHVELGIDNKSDSGADVNYASSIVWANPNNLTSPTNRGDGVPDVFVSCADAAAACGALQLANVVVVKLYVLARADSPTAGYTDSKAYNLGTLAIEPFNDNYKRHVFSTTVRIQNVAGRRLTP